MKLRTRLDLFSAALLSALGATQLACGGKSAVMTTGGGGAGAGEVEQGGSAQAGSSVGGVGQGGAARGGAAQGGAAQGGAAQGGAAQGGAAQGGAAQGGAAPSGAGSAGHAPGPNAYPCKNPKDLGNGFVQCDGFTHRAAVSTCASQVPRPDPVQITPHTACTYDADCKEHPYGWCGSAGQISGTYCYYGCVQDSDCASGQLCECAEPVGRCVAAQCLSDADCASGFLCKGHDASGGCGFTTYSCQSSGDTCGSDADCLPLSTDRRKSCLLDKKTNSFQCSDQSCAIGRPFLVEGAPRLASSAPRTDFRELERLPSSAELSSAQRTRLAEHWTRSALMEHASIAAFARFTLQLLSLAAPASLVECATAAMQDETKHAKACFALASEYASAPIGPGQLGVERSLDESSLEEIVLNTIREGCVGETVAAIEAREAAEYAADPALRALLLEISEDETRHAELAYRFVQWALSIGGPSLERAVQREFAALAASAAAAACPVSDSERALLAHGIVPEALRQTIRSQAIAQIILPCAQALYPAESKARASQSSAGHAEHTS